MHHYLIKHTKGVALSLQHLHIPYDIRNNSIYVYACSTEQRGKIETLIYELSYAATMSLSWDIDETTNLLHALTSIGHEHLD